MFARMASITSLALVLLTALPGRAEAGFHLMKVTEVFAGSPAAPNAQYVVLQMFSANQNFVSGHSVVVYDAADNPVGTFTFGGSVAGNTNQSKILVATTEAATLFGVTADLTMTAVVQAAGGKVCFDAIDCVAWGNFGVVDAKVGTPAAAIPVARALIRRLDISGSGTTLQDLDDTDQSLNDFRAGLPAPVNNAGAVGTPPASTCGNDTLEGLEQCDETNTMDGDGCSSTCELEGSMPDAGVGDAGVLDAGPDDASVPDAGPGTADAAAGTPDAAAPRPDAGTSGSDDDGCGCTGADPSGALPVLFAALMLLWRRRRAV
jgi:uncharacterized protein (TIGR03382 family)